MKPLRITYYHMSDAVHEFWAEHGEELKMLGSCVGIAAIGVGIILLYGYAP